MPTKAPAGATVAWAHDGTVTFIIIRCANLTATHCADAIFTMQDLDGVTRSAFRVSNSNQCFMNVQNVDHDRYVMSIVDSRDGGTLSNVNVGMIAGDVGALRPSVVYEFNDWIDHEPVANATLGVLDLDETYVLRLLPWTNPDITTAPIIWSGKMDHLMQNYTSSFGDAFFWAADDNTHDRVMIYTATGGARQYLSYGADTSQGAADFGTDGTDMVWLHGTGGSTIQGYATTDVMTAPYTQSPPLPPTGFGKRLRSAPRNGFGLSQFVVGCGYAARQAGVLVTIVRLSDGVSWNLTSNDDWYWAAPVAITCSELLVQAAAPKLNYGTLARIRLDSLGPGIPAD